jgi:alpha-mannosidase
MTVETVYLIHHSHTDIGYTHDQPIVFDLHQRFLDEALRLADQYAERDTDGAFRWTVETTLVLYQWLQQASSAQVERFQALERAGRIEVTAMYANLTPLYDLDQLIETFQLLRPLREDYGFTIRHAMNCDVNGENWPLVDLLLDLGIEGLTMAINTHFGGAPLHRPDVFAWEGPSGRSLLAYNGWPYDTGLRFGIGRSAEALEQTWWPRIEARLAQIAYPLPVLMAQSYHPFGDNGPAYGEFCDFIDGWNARGGRPRLVMATPAMWWAAVREHRALLPAYRGDWTDFWNFGCISSAREQAVNRASRVRLRAADALAAAVLADPAAAAHGRTAESFKRYRPAAWQALHLWDEHTWGADVSVRVPGSEETAAQWHHKAGYAYSARSLSLLLQRDALAELAQRVPHAQPDDVLVFNPLPWARHVSGAVPAGTLTPRGTPVDATAGRHFQDRSTELDLCALAAEQAEGVLAQTQTWLRPVEVPGYGYAVSARADLVTWGPSAPPSTDTTIENGRYRLQFDLQRGGLRSWYDKQLEHEWIDPQAPYPFHGYVHETLADTSQAWPRHALFEMAWDSDEVERAPGWRTGWAANRAQPRVVLAHRVYRTPLGWRVVQVLEAPGCSGPLKQSVFLPEAGDFIECEAWWEMGLDSRPEATYLAFPLAIPQAVARLDLGGQAMRPGADQLPGVCRDYFTAQQWVDFSNAELGMTVALPDNPMIQLGDFHFGHYQAEFALERALLLGWVTNNYWETNFRAHQPGQVHARYRFTPHQGGFDEAAAHRLGREAAHARPLFQHLGEPRAGVPLPSTAALLRLPEARALGTPVLTLHVKPAERAPGLIVRLLNASDQPQPAEVASGALQIVSAQVCDLLEQPLQALRVEQGAVQVELAPRRTVTLLLQTELKEAG